MQGSKSCKQIRFVITSHVVINTTCDVYYIRICLEFLQDYMRRYGVAASAERRFL